MGKVKAKAERLQKPKKAPPPSELVLDLFAPGMTPLHRAGLGGLAATMLAMERRRRRGLIAEDALPGDWSNDEPPWEVEPDRITLRFGEPEKAGEYLRRLFAFAFGIKDKLIDLPGTYRDEQSRAVRAELQNGLTLSFLQFGPHRKLDQPTTLYFDVDGSGTTAIAVSLRACASFVHQQAADKLKLLDKQGWLTMKTVETPSAFNPGAVVRHNAYGADTRIEAVPPIGIAAAFGIVGCLSLAVNRGMGVLLVPEVDDLRKFARARPRLTPGTLAECRIAGASDAVLQTRTRLRAAGEMQRHGITGMYAMRLRPTQWNEKQKSRVHALYVSPAIDGQLERFDFALRCLPPRVRSNVKTVTQGRGKSKIATRMTNWFWTDSLVRPLVAENIAAGRPHWYDGFTHLMADRDSGGTPNHQRVTYETEGLHLMVTDEKHDMTEEGELAYVAAVHRAVSMQRGKIYSDTMGAGGQTPNQACKNRWARLMERLRLGLISSKTEEQTRRLVQDDIFGRAGTIRELRDDDTLERVYRLIFQSDWRRLRDLTMLAVVSYKAPAREDQDTEAVDTETA